MLCSGVTHIHTHTYIHTHTHTPHTHTYIHTHMHTRTHTTHTYIHTYRGVSRAPCARCGCSRKFYCYDCYEIVGLESHTVPRVQLPVKVDMWVAIRFFYCLPLPSLNPLPTYDAHMRHGISISHKNLYGGFNTRHYTSVHGFCFL